LLEEAKQNAASWNYLDYAPALKDRPVLIVEADDRNLSDEQARQQLSGSWAIHVSPRLIWRRIIFL